MGAKTEIAWTDASWNPIRGCSVVSEGCKNCYAMEFASRFAGEGQAYEGLAFRTKDGHGHWTGQIMEVEKHLEDPLHWKQPKRIFVNSMSDLMHPHLSTHFFHRIMVVMKQAHWHTFQVLTKRPERYTLVNEWLDEHNGGEPLPNVWWGTSTETQKRLVERCPHLVAVKAVVRFLSCEPLLERLDLARVPGYPFAIYREAEWVTDRMMPSGFTYPPRPGRGLMRISRKPDIHWVIVGAESGRHRRAYDQQWARDIRDQCLKAGIAYFYKQGSALKPGQHEALDGVEWKQFPEVASLRSEPVAVA